MHSDLQYASVEEIESVVRKFEACEFRKEDFTHTQHLTVAAWYLSQFPCEQALARMRSSLLRFTAHLGMQAYHETITSFWLRLLACFLGKANSTEPLLARINSILELFADKNLLFHYYSRELVMSAQAKAEWVEPDLKPISDNSEAAPAAS